MDRSGMSQVLPNNQDNIQRRQSKKNVQMVTGAGIKVNMIFFPLTQANKTFNC